MKKDRLKILFVIRKASTFYYFQSIVESLCLRNHQVKVIFDRKFNRKNSLVHVDKFKKEVNNFDYYLRLSRTNFWRRIIFPVREISNYRHYLIMKGQPDYYRRRLIIHLPRLLQPLVQYSLINALLKNKVIGGLLKFVEYIVPPDKFIMNKIREDNPDVVVISPGNRRHSATTVEHLKAAKYLGIPTAIQVMSWDNLTVKGVFPIIPDIMLAWNETHARQAQERHGISAERIRIIGAPLLDKWFSGLKPSCTRAEFCAQHNLCEDAPIITHLGSSGSVAEDETWLIKSLLEALKNSSDARLRQTQFIIRPHPGNWEIYKNLEDKNLKVIPKRGSAPDTENNLQLFYDSLYYSAATVGIFTSGMINAIIMRKPSITIVMDEFRTRQLDTLHFRPLLQSNALEIAHTPEEFVKIVGNFLDGKDSRKEKRETFVRNFIRPRGLEKLAGDIAAQEIENVAQIRNNKN